MKHKSKLVAVLLALSITSMPISAYASDICVVTAPQVTVEHRADAIDPFASFDATVMVSGSRSGMYCKSYSNVTAYYHKAQCSVNNNGQSVTRSGWTTQYNTTSASSSYVYSTTNICTYTGEGQSKHTSTSNLKAGTVYKSYK